jgi:hypothetical protein
LLHIDQEITLLSDLPSSSSSSPPQHVYFRLPTPLTPHLPQTIYPTSNHILPQNINVLHQILSSNVTMVRPAETTDDFAFIMACVKHSSGKPDFDEVAKELGAKSKDAW